MAEYIDRRDAQRAIFNKEEHFFADDRFPDSEFAYNDALLVAVNALDEIPAADVAPVIHAHWRAKEPAPWCSWYATCSVCEERMTLEKRFTNYCPNCGAKMDEEDNNDRSE